MCRSVMHVYSVHNPQRLNKPKQTQDQYVSANDPHLCGVESNVLLFLSKALMDVHVAN